MTTSPPPHRPARGSARRWTSTGGVVGGAVLAVVVLVSSCAPKHEYPDGRGIEGQLEREVIALQMTVKDLQTKLATCDQNGEADPIFAELSQVLTHTEVAVGHDGPVTTVTLPESHLFGADAESIRAEAKMSLDVVATALKAHGDETVVIEGHTADAAPTALLARKYPDLYDLSYARAAAVKRVLVRDFQVPEDRFTLSARGPSAPVASNDTPGGQSQNRRVVLYIYPPGARR